MGKPLDFTFYNPDQLDDETFLTGFVARQALVTKILGRLGDIKPRGLAQHRLIVGQRGMGKTSLLRRVALGIRDEPALAAVLLPLSFREEQYNVHNLHIFWCNCLDSFGDWLESAGRREDARRLDCDVVTLNAQEDDEEGSRALALFKRWMKEEQKRPLLLLDNIDIIFAGLKTKQWSLRRMLQEAGGIVVIGASAAALEAAADREAAFYDFFQVDVLSKLEHHEVLLCLRHMAQQREEAGRRVLQILDRDPARIHVLYDLTGGNPRTLAFLYLVLETGGDDDVMRDLERLLDQATPLYKARVEELAPQTRVVFDALALAWDPATAASLAGMTGLEVGVVSTHLDRLLKDGVIEKTSLSSTRRTAYQIAERFFNIWYLMRHSSRRQRLRLRWLTEMLRRIYTPRELRERATGLLGGAENHRLSSPAYCLALSDALDDRELRVALRHSSRRHPSFAGEGDAPTEDDLYLPSAATEPVNKETAAVTYRKAIEYNPLDPTEIDPQNARAWNNLGILLKGPLGRPAEAEVAYRKAIEIDPQNTWAWNSLGNLLSDHLFRPDEAEKAYRTALSLDPQNTFALANLTYLLIRQGDGAATEIVCQDAIAALPQHGAGLLQAFHALAADDFGTATEELRAVLEEGHSDLFTVFRDDLLRNLQFAAERGNGDKLLAWLESSGFSERYRPLYVAFDAYLHGEERLMDVNPEVRNGAKYLLAEMTRRPSEPAQPEPVKKQRKRRSG